MNAKVEHPSVPDEAAPTVMNIATVTPLKPVDGTKRKRKTRSDKGKVRPSVELNHVVVDPRVLTAAKQAIRPGQRLVIVDAETVRLVNES